MRLRSARLLHLTVSTLSQCGRIVLKLGLPRKISLLLFFRMCDTETAVMTLKRSGWDLEYSHALTFRRIDSEESDFHLISLHCLFQIFFSGSYPISIGFRVGDIFAEF